MTISELKGLQDDFITPALAAPVLGVDAQSIRAQAQADKDKLGFPVSVVGTRIRIPRLPFIAYVTGERTGY